MRSGNERLLVDHKQFLATLSPNKRNDLMTLADAPALRHLAGHVGLIALLAVGIALRVSFWGLLVPMLGIAMAFLFTLQHECTHRTPFRSGWINEWVGHACAVVLAQPFLWFRYFHLAHHRFTNDPDNDPELAGDGKPETWGQYIWHVSAIGYWVAKMHVLLGNAFGALDAPYLPPRTHARIRVEARILLMFYAVAAIALATMPWAFWIWPGPLLIGFPILRLYLLAEHAHCPAVANMFDNTRTTLTNRAVRFLAWNMPYHAEHHAAPAVPFHKLPNLHELVRKHLGTVDEGYIAFTRDYTTALTTKQASRENGWQHPKH